MNSTNKKSRARGIPEPFNRGAGHASQFKPVAAQLKTAMSAQRINRPVTPALHLPQLKASVAQQIKNPAQMKTNPVAPPVYRPQQLPKVLQTNKSASQTPPVDRDPRLLGAPPIYRPDLKRTGVQAKMAISSPAKSHPVVPPARYSRRVPQVLQSKRTVVQRHVQRDGPKAKTLHVSGIGAQIIQRAGHRPSIGMQVRYQGQIWNVTASAPGNPQITIFRAPNNTVNLQWAAANFTIIRANNAQDYDLRQNDLGAGGGPVDVYDAAGFLSRREDQVMARFQQAKARALIMIKATANPHVGFAYQAGLNALTLDDFATSQTGRTLIGPSATQSAEWQCSWVEGQIGNPRRTWLFVIDVDNPLPDSNQDPHVGWTVSAQAGTQGAVANVFGHVWLDHVPVSRQ